MSDHPFSEPPTRAIVVARHNSVCPICRSYMLVGEAITEVDGRWVHAEGGCVEEAEGES
jgi:hypothetical protein